MSLIRMIRNICDVENGTKAVILMVMVQISYSVLNVLNKLAYNDFGLNIRVALTYRFIFATAFMAPLALFFERKKMVKISWRILFQTLLCGLFGGVMAQNFYSGALVLTSLTFASNINNLTPLFTFIVSLCFRMENLNWRAAAGKAKILGIVTAMGGTMLLTLFKGPQLDTPSFHVSFLHPHVASPHSATSASSGNSNIALGALCVVGGGLSFALWFIVQAKVSEKYPCHYSSTALMNVMASVLSVAFAFCVDRDWSEWRLGWNIKLLTVAYSGLVPGGIMVVVIAWCVHMRGPLFVSIFSPMVILISAFVQSFLMGEKLNLGTKKRPKMTRTILFQAFLCGLFGGALSQNFYLEALALTSATFASAMSNLIPAITFIMALCFRLERANLQTAAGKAKVIGTITGIGGAMTLTFFKGIEIHTTSHVSLLHHPHDAHVASPYSSSASHTLLGALCALCSCFSYALWLIIQTKMSEKYPSHYTSTALMSGMGSLLSIGFALSLERDWAQWKLGWNIRLLTAAYSGIVVSGIMVVVVSWCVHMRGPLFVSVFNPLMLVIVAVAGCVMLEEKLYLGTIIGGVLIVCGLYVVLWGKGEEMKKKNQLVPSHTLHEIIVKSPPQDQNRQQNSSQLTTASDENTQQEKE